MESVGSLKLEVPAILPYSCSVLGAKLASLVYRIRDLRDSWPETVRFGARWRGVVHGGELSPEFSPDRWGVSSQ